MKANLFYILALILFTRLIFQYRAFRINFARTLIKTGIEIFGLLLLPLNPWIALLIVTFILVNILSFYLEKNNQNINMKRILVLIIYLIPINLIFPFYERASALAFLQPWLHQLSQIFFISQVIPKPDWNTIFIILSGLLLCINEANVFIRYFFEMLHLAPQRNEEETHPDIDIKEYNRGRIIGFLERILIYFFVLIGNYSAIGFIVAAKGVTRFKELEKRNFAEYFLIGTLLSTILAGSIALFIRLLL